MDFLIKNARNTLDAMKQISKRLKEIDRDLKVNKDEDERLYGEQFKLVIDLSREFNHIDDLLKHLECDEQTMFIATRFRRQANELIGERESYDINGNN